MLNPQTPAIAEPVRKYLTQITMQAPAPEISAKQTDCKPIRSNYQEWARLAMVSVEAFLRAADGEAARNYPSEDVLPPQQVLTLLTEDPVKLHYRTAEGQDMVALRAKVLIDTVESQSARRVAEEKFAKTYPGGDFERFRRALDFAYAAHSGQYRDSGQPYIIHPVAVAGMIMEMGMDIDSVIAGLLHDTIEDCGATVEGITELFGASVAGLVNGVTKLTKASFASNSTKEQQQAENVRKMFLAMAKDMRVIPIKLADRLHNMRTLEYCGSEKRERKARETLEIYAPLAHRLGMGRIKCELEDLSFMHLHPEEYETLRQRVDQMRVERDDFIKKSIETLQGEDGGERHYLHHQRTAQASLQYLPQNAESAHLL